MCSRFIDRRMFGARRRVEQRHLVAAAREHDRPGAADQARPDDGTRMLSWATAILPVKNARELPTGAARCHVLRSPDARHVGSIASPEKMHDRGYRIV
jgi:hypothetical protein